MKRRIIVVLAAVVALLGFAASPASADDPVEQRFYSEITVNTWDVLCRARIVNIDPGVTNSDVKGYFEAYSGAGCKGWLERKTNEYNWTKVSDDYWVSSGQTRSTGWHWNGTNAGSRVCIVLTANGQKACSLGIW